MRRKRESGRCRRRTRGRERERKGDEEKLEGGWRVERSADAKENVYGPD